MEISLFNSFQFVVIGTAVGFLGGFLGVGGGVIMVPLLIFWAFPSIHIPTEIIVHLAFGTSLAIIIPTSISSTWAHSRAKNVSWRVVFLLVPPGIFASLLGSTVAAHLKGSLLKTLFGLVLVVLSAQMLLQRKKLEESAHHPTPKSLPTLIIGFVVGFFSAFFGLGGGVIAVPLMVRFLAIPIHRAVGSSISFVLFASLVGTAGYIINGLGQPGLPAYSLGYVHTIAWVLAGIPSVFLAQWGAQLAHRTRPLRLRQAFALLLMAVGIRMLF